MILDVEFYQDNQSFDCDFGEIQNITDGGFEKGYQQGYEEGINDGYSEGYEEGLSKRTYETWTITLNDGTIIEKEVALL